VQFEIVNELLEPQETRLDEALARLKAEMRLPGLIGDMATEIKRTAAGVTSLWDTNAWADTESHGDLLRPLMEETRNALRDHAHLGSPRAERQKAKSIWSPRRNRRGRDHKINPDLLVAVLEVVERIAGRQLSYSRSRIRSAPINAPTSGPPGGAMFDVLLAALDWAYALPSPQRRSASLKAEGVLSAVKRLRRPSGQN
jgi:hypothetical protein